MSTLHYYNEVEMSDMTIREADEEQYMTVSNTDANEGSPISRRNIVSNAQVSSVVRKS